MVDNNSCQTMFANYYMNPEDGNKFDAKYSIKCLSEEIFTKRYELDGLNYKILSELLDFQKQFPESTVLKVYKESLKKRFYIKTEIVDRDSVKAAIKIIGDNNFRNALLEQGLYINELSQ
ncbi:MAG: hypothetical protein GY828_06425 [Candidatus Gracilibacteria bacterium]|nr:hypothetical protein [Candidatus Gracilibacteria bacterium]